MALSYQAIYGRLKRFIANNVNLAVSDIKAAMALAKHPLLYDSQGLRTLARSLNTEFSIPPMNRNLTRDQTGKAKTVRDLAVLIRKAYQ